MSFPPLTQRQLLVKLLDMLVEDAGFHATVSANECEPMKAMPHSGIWVKTQRTTKGDELTDEAQRLTAYLEKLGVFDTTQLINYLGANGAQGTRSEELLFPLKMDVAEALRAALQEAQHQAKESRTGIRNVKMAHLHEIAVEGGFELELAADKPKVEVESPYREGYLRMLEKEKDKDPKGQSL